jgi:uncharacterized membrane protein YedE/YeeE
VVAALAFVLAALAGFAAQRGSICAVAAVKDLVLRRDARLYAAFFECAGWSLAAAGALGMVGVRSGAVEFPATGLAAAGGALFGAGAVINGACAFGSAARLARGDLSFLFMPVGFLAGAYALSHGVPAPAPSAAPALQSPIVAALLVIFVGWRLYGAADGVRSLKALRDHLTAASWNPVFAMAVIGLSSGALMALYAPWPYSTLLVDIAAGNGTMDQAKKIALALMFLAGAGLAARSSGAFRVKGPGLRSAAEKFAGGVLMGAGGYLIPGGNDALVLGALPHFFLYGIVAYAAMTAMIAAFVLAEARLTPAPRRA